MNHSAQLMRLRFTPLAVTLLFYVNTLCAQDNWIGLQQSVDVKAYAGKAFKYAAVAKTDGSAAVLSMLGAQVTKANGEWGYFNNGAGQPITEAAWTARTIQGT